MNAMNSSRHTDEPTATASQRPSIVKSIRTTWVVYVIALVFVASTLISLAVNQKRSDAEHKVNTRVIAAQAQERADLNCVAQWANAYTSRAKYISDLSTAQNNALAKALHDVAIGNAKAIRGDAKAYDDAHNAYNQALKLHPIPDSPQFVCNLSNAGYPATPATPAATPTPSTVTAPGPTSSVVVTVPGSVTTELVPGPTGTTTVRRTATRTVTAPASSVCVVPKAPPLCVPLPHR